jgi:hypothetical protein
MATISKKAWPEFFEKVLSGEKHFDLRLADFDIATGDTLVLEEWNPETKTYTGRRVEKDVGYVMRIDFEKLHMFSKQDVLTKGLQIISLN